MHSYACPEHEIRIGELARKVGFSQVSLSHQIMQRIKLVKRGQTCCVDAYLNPHSKHINIVTCYYQFSVTYKASNRDSMSSYLSVCRFFSCSLMAAWPISTNSLARRPSFQGLQAVSLVTP